MQLRKRFLFLALGAFTLGGWTLLQPPETPFGGCSQTCAGEFPGECVHYYVYESFCSDANEPWTVCYHDDDGCFAQ